MRVPTGAYRLAPGDAYRLALAADFFGAYNEGRLSAITRVLGPDPILTDCNYLTGTIVVVRGRAQLESYFRDQFADNDNWAVEFFNEDPGNYDTVGVRAVQRQSSTILALGAAGGVKRDFDASLALVLEPDHEHISVVGLATVGAIHGRLDSLCQVSRPGG